MKGRGEEGEEVAMAVYYRAAEEKGYGSDERVLLEMEIAGETTTEEEEDDNASEISLTRKDLVLNEGKAVFNMINSIIGAGIIGIPYALHEAGFMTGIALLVVVAIITDYSLRLLIRSGIKSGKFSYQEVMSYAFGKWGFWYLSLIQFLFPFTGMLSYLVIVGDTIPEILNRISALEGTVLASHEFVKFLMVLIVMLPLSLYRNIDKLGKVSAFSIICVCFIVVVVVVRAGTLGPDIPRTPGAYSIARSGVFQGVGIMAFAFVCHHNSFLIYFSLAYRSAKKFSKVTHISVFASWVACALLGLAGYLTFTGHTEGDLLRNYCRDDDLLSATRFLYAITIMLTFPIECFVAREVVSILYANFRKDGKEKKFWFHALVTCCIVGLVLVISLPINNLGTVLEFTGCLTATPLAFILPAALFLKITDGRIISKGKFPALLLLLFGMAVMITGTVLAILETVDYTDVCERWSYCNKTLLSMGNDSAQAFCVS